MRNTTYILVGVNVAVFLIQLILGDTFTNAFVLVSSDVLTRPWILITSMFLHANIMHLLFNMYVLFMFGQIISGLRA